MMSQIRNWKNVVNFHFVQKVNLTSCIRTSVAVLMNGPSNTYSVQLSQHLFSRHVVFGVTQWNLGVPVMKYIPAI